MHVFWKRWSMKTCDHKIRPGSWNVFELCDSWRKVWHKRPENNECPEFRIEPISAQKGYGQIAQINGKKTSRVPEIFLLHDKGHFDPILTMTGFHMTSYYCSYCGKTCSNKEGIPAAVRAGAGYITRQTRNALTQRGLKTVRGQSEIRNVLHFTRC